MNLTPHAAGSAKPSAHVSRKMLWIDLAPMLYLARAFMSSSATVPLLRKLRVYFKLPFHPEEKPNQDMVMLQEALQSMPMLSGIQRGVTRLIARRSTAPKRTLKLIYPYVSGMGTNL